MLQVAQGSVGKPLPPNLNDNQSANDGVVEVITLMDDDDWIDVETYNEDFSHQVLYQALSLPRFLILSHTGTTQTGQKRGETELQAQELITRQT